MKHSLLGLPGLCVVMLLFGQPATAKLLTAINQDWRSASQQGQYDLAASLASANDEQGALARLIQAAEARQLASHPQWRAFLHYKPETGNRWLSQVDSAHFFLSDIGKTAPEAELRATLAAFFSVQAKPPLRLTAYCRFVARRYWLMAELEAESNLLPEQPCPEFDRYVSYLDADVLTLIFPTAHPNSPSSAFGHTLLRVDKKDQRAESRLLNMSINFAAEVPEGVTGSAYAIKGLAGGFPGKFRLLPYHMKLREYGQIENRDTWEYTLALDKAQVDLVLRHTYEMLISHFDYFFFSENCSYHLLSLLEVAFPDRPLTEEFGLWTIPVDTIRLLQQEQLIRDVTFVPSSIRSLRSRRMSLSDNDNALALRALDEGVDAIDPALQTLSKSRQAGVLDLLSDYERYRRLQSDPSALGSSSRERAILSRRSKLGIKSSVPEIVAPQESPDAGHGTTRVGLQYHHSNSSNNTIELQFRPAYHDFRDPSAAFDDKAAIQLGLIGIAYDTTSNDVFLRRLNLISIESIEPRGLFFKPISWHTNVLWQRPVKNAPHEFIFNAGAGVAYQKASHQPVVYAFGESDFVDAPAFEQRQHLRLGVSLGTQWEPIAGIRTGLDWDFRRQVGSEFHQTTTEAWLGFALAEQWSVNLDITLLQQKDRADETQISLGIRAYF